MKMYTLLRKLSLFFLFLLTFTHAALFPFVFIDFNCLLLIFFIDLHVEASFEMRDKVGTS